jgi:hypothetical protein
MRDPLQNVQPPKLPQLLPRVLSIEETDKLLKYLRRQNSALGRTCSKQRTDCRPQDFQHKPELEYQSTHFGLPSTRRVPLATLQSQSRIA